MHSIAPIELGSYFCVIKKRGYCGDRVLEEGRGAINALI